MKKIKSILLLSVLGFIAPLLIFILGVALYFFGYLGNIESQLFNCAYTGNWGRFAKLVERCSDYSVEDEYGQSLFWLACGQADESIVQKMIEQGADVNMRSDINNGIPTPLHYAVYSGSVSNVRVLLQNGAILNIPDSYQRTELYWIFKEGLVCRQELAKLLLENGADPNVCDKYGWSPLHYALMMDPPPSVELIELLICHGADVNAKNTNPVYADSNPFEVRKYPTGQTPLQLAIDGGCAEIVELLRKHGAVENN